MGVNGVFGTNSKRCGVQLSREAYAPAARQFPPRARPFENDGTPLCQAQCDLSTPADTGMLEHVGSSDQNLLRCIECKGLSHVEGVAWAPTGLVGGLVGDTGHLRPAHCEGCARPIGM